MLSYLLKSCFLGQAIKYQFNFRCVAVCHEWEGDEPFQCCIRDEGRSFTYALQEECVNHFMVLSCKSEMVLNDEEKASRRCQVGVGELNASKPFDEVSKATKLLVKLWVCDSDRTDCSGQTALLATDQPALRRQESYTGFYMEREKLPLRCAKVPYRGSEKSLPTESCNSRYSKRKPRRGGVAD